MSADTIPARLQRWAREQPDAPAYHVRSDGRWRSVSWRTFAAEVRQAGLALMALGIEPGDTICILGANRPEWVLGDLACMSIGGAPAGIYTTCSPAEVRYIVDHAEAKVVLVENQGQWEKIRAERAGMPRLRRVVLMKGAPPVDDPLVMSWEAFLAEGNRAEERAFDERLGALAPDRLGTLIYTSGTTGPPKAVMLSHGNLTWTADALAKVLQVGPADCTLSYLPLSHIAEQMSTIHVAISSGSSVYYAEAIDKVADNLREVQPTLLFAVPRIWEKFHAGVSAKLAAAGAPQRALVGWARGVGRRAAELRNQGLPLPVALQLQHGLAERLVFRKLKARLGLGRARLFISGAAPIAREILELFAELDISILEVYGQSEDSGPTSINRPGRTRLGTVGPPLDGLAVRFAPDGEILVKGPNVFLGYLKEPAATAEALVDGWLHSGDLGELDADGFLAITGRKKDIIITAGGKNIAPRNIEGALKNHRLVSEAVVIGDRRKYLTALIALDPEAAAAFLAERGEPAERAHENPAVVAAVQTAVDEINRDLARVETVKKFHLLPRPFSVETGELTPSLKVKRKVVNELYAEQIEAMYRPD